MDPVASGELQCRGIEGHDVAEHKIGKVVAFDTRVLTVGMACCARTTITSRSARSTPATVARSTSTLPRTTSRLRVGTPRRWCRPRRMDRRSSDSWLQVESLELGETARRERTRMGFVTVSPRCQPR